MPVLCADPTLRLNQKQFGEISCRVTAHVFAIHRNFGRLFDERSYKQELARRLLRHLPLEAVQWINITNHVITLTTIRRTTKTMELRKT